MKRKVMFLNREYEKYSVIYAEEIEDVQNDKYFEIDNLLNLDQGKGCITGILTSMPNIKYAIVVRDKFEATATGEKLIDTSVVYEALVDDIDDGQCQEQKEEENHKVDIKKLYS